MANSSAETIIGRAWKKLRKNGSTTDVPALQQEEMLASLHDINNEWRRAFRMGAGEPLNAMKKEKGYDLVDDTAVNNANGVATTDVTITVDSTAVSSTAGAAVVWDDDVPDTIE